MPIEAKSSDLPQPIQAFAALDLGLPASPPEWLMVMPSGRHKLNATQGGRPVAVAVQVDGETAAALEASRKAHLAASPQRPYFDFDHAGGAAAAWPQEFVYREAPRAGVYARVAWSKAGAEAISGRTYRAFSPSFFLDGDRVSGAPLNMGGLVNDPAFKQISPLWAKDAGATSGEHNQGQQAQPPNRMTEQELAALQAKLKELEQENAGLKAKAEGTEKQDAIDAKQAEIDALKTRLSAAETALAAQRKEKAQAAVQAAVARGALPPKDTALQAKWSQWCEASPEMIEALAAIPGAPVLAGRVTPPDRAGGVQVLDEDPKIIRSAYAEAFAKNLQCRSTSDKVLAAREMAAIYARGIRNNQRFHEMPVEAATVSDSTGTLAGALVTQRVLDLFKLQLPLLRNIVTDFSSENASYNQAITTRILTVPTVQTYTATLSSGRPAGWSTGDTPTATDATVTMSNHKGVPLVIDSNAPASTNRRIFEEFAPAASYALAKDIHDAMLALIVTGSFTDPAAFAAPIGDFGRPTFAKAARILNGKGAPMMDRYALVNSTFWEKLVQDPTIVSLAVYQKPTVITDAELPMISKFQPYECPNLPTTGNLCAFFAHKSALLLATRVPNDYTLALPGASNGRVSVITNPDDGLSVMLTEYVNHQAGSAERRISIMYGVDEGVTAGGQIVTSQ